ncbi:hypothetical protein SAMN05446935_8357 [Burkholderia sp. YR290]|nr:hypothetical protein SAMN05446935_8357 [Burkholderia sp. YR290]
MRTSSSVEVYISTREWTFAKLPACPLHPSGGCGIARHGSYARAQPPGIRVARWYCPKGHRTFSLLPHFLAARLPGLLVDVEETIFAAARSPSIEAAAASMRDLGISLRSAVRWLRRRLLPVQRAVRTLREADTEVALVIDAGFLTRLRVALEDRALGDLPPPLGFRAKGHGQQGAEIKGRQHKMVADVCEQAIYPGRQRSLLPPLVCSRDPTGKCSPNAHPPTGISSACGAQTASSVRAPRGNTCIG